MARAISLSMQVKRAAVPLACLGFALYFAYHALIGDFGLFAWLDLQREEARLEEQLAALRAQRLDLEHRVSLMRPESLDPDMLDERARETLNLAHPNDLTIFRNAR